MSQTKSHIIVTQVGNDQMTVKDVGTSEDYPQIQIVNAVGNSDPEENKSKLIFIGTGCEILRFLMMTKLKNWFVLFR